ncbi:MAG: nickel pincer cofactor biosynthesis protein LarC [Dehalococcoidia bacterium]|nr:nickel pincer cofactor biosynthesis protein LarC [Dehalococcoidia bacterium]|tara:strand:+ start:3419 stop:4618 length:1200 start_codon:yes stop_codon:yes gene_type:complete
MRIAYIQPIGGASGDMMLGALTDLGMPIEYLENELARLNVSGYRLEARQETRSEMRGTYLKVYLDDETRYSPKQLLGIVESSGLSDPVKHCSCLILKALWEAECRVHGEAQDILELEELGSVDTLVDVVGSAIGFEYLDVAGIHAGPLVIGNATPPRWPGGYSNPAPATLELIAAAGAPVIGDKPMYKDAGELTTPTGAALITTLAEFGRPGFSVDQVGLGLGTKDLVGFPNALRVWLGDNDDSEVGTVTQHGEVILLETNLDDVSGLVLGYTQERLFSIGALDVWNTPIQMKKNRPGTVLSVIVSKDKEREAVELILKETPTLGVRTRPIDRYVAGRQMVTVETDLGSITVKTKLLDGQPISASPEPDEVRRIALETQTPFQEVYQIATEAARRQLLK